MLIVSFFICLVIFNALSLAISRFWEKPQGIPGLAAYIALMAYSYPRSAELKAVIASHRPAYGYGLSGRIGSIMPDQANNWDWLAIGATGAILVYGFFAYTKATEHRSYRNGDTYQTGHELEFNTIAQLFFFGAVAVLAIFAGYKLLSD